MNQNEEESYTNMEGERAIQNAFITCLLTQTNYHLCLIEHIRK